MSAITCSKCNYFDDDNAKKQCKRYSVPVDEDNICVDSDELYDMTDSILKS